MSPKPFTININQSVLDDLKYRLEHTRWPDEAKDAGWKYGTNLEYLKDLVDYWQHTYDWRKHEKELNALPHFTAKVGDTSLHFLHQPSKNPDAIPLLLVHGWPDSFYRFHKVLPLLGDYHVVVPSLPGSGFSGQKAVDTDTAADMLAELMQSLGYEQFVCAGGDTGSAIAMSLAARQPKKLLGMHLTDVGYPDQTTDFASLTAPEQEFAGFIQGWWFAEGAFNMIQSTKPQSLAYAFNDSPSGLAGWILSMMTAMSTGEALEKRIPRDELLTNIMIYWVTETIGSSMRSYYESAAAAGEPSQRSTVPAGVARCPEDAPLPREWADRRVNLVQYSELARGGHFAAWEQPKIWADDLSSFISHIQ